MNLSPAEIANKQFSVALRGYEKSEVDAFLAELAAEIDRRLADAPPRTTDPTSFAQLGQEVTAVLESATTAAEAMRARAREDAEAMRAAAERESEEVRRRTHEEAEATRRAAEEAAAELTRATDEYATNLRATTERDAHEMREAAIIKARATAESAEADARRIRSQAEQEASELLDEALRRHARLKAFEREARARASAVDQALRSIMNELAAAEADDAGGPEVPAFATDNAQAPSLLDAWNAPAPVETRDEATHDARDAPSPSEAEQDAQPRRVTPAASVHFDDLDDDYDARVGSRDNGTGEHGSRP